MNNLAENIDVTVHSLLYILKQLGGKGDFHKVFKIMYFADQKHLVKYGAPISNEKYIAMQNGPVPSAAYDILKALRGEGLLKDQKTTFDPFFKLENSFKVTALAEPDFDLLSESELTALNESIKENRSKSFKVLTDKSHDEAWTKAMGNSEMKVLDIAKAGGASKDMIKYIKTHLENQFAEFE